MLFILVWFLTSLWVLIDAKKNNIRKISEIKGLTNMSPVGWFIGCLLLWIIVFPLYLVNREDLIKRSKSAGTGIRKCPFCAEEIKLDAKVCKHCKKDVSPEEKPSEKPVLPNDNKFKKFILWLVLVAVLLFFVVIVNKNGIMGSGNIDEFKDYNVVYGAIYGGEVVTDSIENLDTLANYVGSDGKAYRIGDSVIVTKKEGTIKLKCLPRKKMCVMTPEEFGRALGQSLR